MLETALSLDRCVSAAWNTAVVLVLAAVCDVQSRVVSLSAIPFTGFGAVMSVPLGLTAAHGVDLRSARGIRSRLAVAFGPLVGVKQSSLNFPGAANGSSWGI